MDDAISKRISFDSVSAQGVTDPVRLGGTYRLHAHGQTAELELVETTSLKRSVVYASEGETWLVVPVGIYRLYWRAITQYASDGGLELVRLTSIGKAGFYFKKIASLVLTGRIDRVVVAIASRLKGPADWIVGVHLGKNVQTARAATIRPVVAPVAVPSDLRFVSIIIPTKERVDLLRACIASLDMIAQVRFELVIVDNGATLDEMVAFLQAVAELPHVRVLHRPGPFNFSWLCNEGARAATAPVLLFLNDDIEARDGDWLDIMLGYLARADTGVVGARLLYPSGALQHAGIAANLVPGPGHPWLGLPNAELETNPLIASSGEVDAVTGACLMLRKTLFEKLGGFNETDFAVTLNDVDLCLRVRESGLMVVYVAQAKLIHKEGQSRPADDRPEECARRTRELGAFYRRHEAYARVSCFYPPALRRDTVLASPI